MEDTEIVERLVKVEQSNKSAHHRLDEQEGKIKELQETNKILTNMNYRMGQVEDEVKQINLKMDEVKSEKGKKWDKLIDYLFYFVAGTILTYIAVKLGLK